LPEAFGELPLSADTCTFVEQLLLKRAVDEGRHSSSEECVVLVDFDLLSWAAPKPSTLSAKAAPELNTREVWIDAVKPRNLRHI
jgi:hypothetical protein